jgi:hypothetical protein
MNEDEQPFEGSQLQTEVRNADSEKLTRFYSMIKNACESLPDSAFWSDALEYTKSKMKPEKTEVK